MRRVRAAARDRTILAVRQVARAKPLPLLVLALLAAGCALKPPTGPAGAPAVAEASAQLQQAQALVGKSQWQPADALLRRALARPDFAGLPASQQHALVSLAALAAVQIDDSRRALALSIRACGFATGDARDWFTRMRAAAGVPDPREAVSALTTLAQRWPQVLARLTEFDDIEYVMRPEFLAGVSEAERYELLAALHKIKFLDEPRGSGAWWREFALLQLARGERSSAVQTLARITDPYVVVSIEADRRFDGVRGEPGALITVPQAIQESIDAELRHAQLAPDRLEPTNHLAEILNYCARQRQALSVTDAAIEYREEHGGSAWSDYQAQFSWVLSNRADALFGLGRYQAAIVQMEAASHLHPEAAQNVDAAITLAGMYNGLGQTEQAAATLQRVSPTDLNPYGRMRLEAERLHLALAQHDEPAATRALDYLRSHREEGLGTLQEALLAAHRDDEGAALLVTRLREPQLRSAALLAVQVYADEPGPPAALEEESRWRALLQRADVQQAIEGVGRVARYPLLMSDL